MLSKIRPYMNPRLFYGSLLSGLFLLMLFSRCKKNNDSTSQTSVQTWITGTWDLALQTNTTITDGTTLYSDTTNVQLKSALRFTKDSQYYISIYNRYSQAFDKDSGTYKILNDTTLQITYTGGLIYTTNIQRQSDNELIYYTHTADTENHVDNYNLTHYTRD